MSVQLTQMDAEIVFYDVFGKILHRLSTRKHLHSSIWIFGVNALQSYLVIELCMPWWLISNFWIFFSLLPALNLSIWILIVEQLMYKDELEQNFEWSILHTLKSSKMPRNTSGSYNGCPNNGLLKLCNIRCTILDHFTMTWLFKSLP